MYPSNRFRSVRRGVTMVEIMVVIVLIGILSTIAVPRFMSYSGLSQLEGDSNKVFLFLQRARSLAVKSNRFHFVQINTSNGTLSLYEDSNSSNTYDSTDTFLAKESLGVSVRIGFGPNWSTLPTSMPPGASGFATVSVPLSGLALGVNTSTSECSAVNTDPGSWTDGINFCSGVLGDVETGALFMTTTRSEAKAIAILYNDLGAQGALQIRRYTWQGSSWTKD